VLAAQAHEPVTDGSTTLAVFNQAAGSDHAYPNVTAPVSAEVWALLIELLEDGFTLDQLVSWAERLATRSVNTTVNQLAQVPYTGSAQPSPGSSRCSGPGEAQEASSPTCTTALLDSHQLQAEPRESGLDARLRVVGATLATNLVGLLDRLEESGERADLELVSVTLSAPPDTTRSALVEAGADLGAYCSREPNAGALLVLDIGGDGNAHLHGIVLSSDRGSLVEYWCLLVAGTVAAQRASVVTGSGGHYVWCPENKVLLANLHRRGPGYGVCDYPFKPLPDRSAGLSMADRVVAATGVVGAAWAATAKAEARAVQLRPRRLHVGPPARRDDLCPKCGGTFPAGKRSNAKYCRDSCRVLACRQRKKSVASARSPSPASGGSTALVPVGHSPEATP
jgi:hypothetical protein